MGIKKVKETKQIGEHVTVDMEIDNIDGEDCDTRVTIIGELWVPGKKRKEFTKKLGDLINEYRI